MAFAEQSEFMVNFTGGHNTEASSLNFPEDAAQEIDNFDLFITGEVKRRLGLDFESGYTVRPETTTAANISTYAISKSEWRAANGKGDLNFQVVQIGTTLYLHDQGADPISATLRGTVSLSGSKVGDVPEDKVLSFAYGEGVMIVGNSDLDPTIVEYDEVSETFSTTRITLQKRDFDGVDEAVDVDNRPSALTPDHRYNLRNQGWPVSTRCANDDQGDDGVTKTDPIGWARSKVFVYPSNADVFHAAKMSAADDARSIGTFSPWDMEKIATGNTPAPSGHYVLDVFAEDRVGTSGIVATDNGKTTNKRPSVISFYAGRVWFGGVPDSNYSGDLYFSQSLTDLKNAGKCYQDFDPTAEDLNALLATDGGVIHIADLGAVHKMVEVGQDLVIVASTGVWAIAGESARGNFTADGFSVRKITGEGSIAKESILVTEGNIWWWGEGGIWRMQGSQIDDSLVVDRITRNTIQTLYDGIGNAAKAYTRGFYDPYGKKVYWLYNDTLAFDGITDRFWANRMLIMDTTLESFYNYTIEDLDTNSPKFAGLTIKSPGSEAIVTYDIFQNDDDVVEAADDIVQDVAFESFSNIQLKALCFVENEDTTWSYTFGEFNDTAFHDWKAWDQVKNDIDGLGANFDSIIQTGWRNSQDPTRDKTITHVTSFFNRTEDGYEDLGGGIVEYSNPSSAMASVRWEYTDLDVGQWTTAQQAYRFKRWYMPADDLDPFDYGYSTIRTKLRMRGRGEAFSIRYESEESKDMQLLGFAINLRAGKRA